MQPKKNLLYWPRGKYVPAVATNVAETFKRERERLAEAKYAPSCQITLGPVLHPGGEG
jgi:hypothetical protein